MGRLDDALDIFWEFLGEGEGSVGLGEGVVVMVGVAMHALFGVKLKLLPSGLEGREGENKWQ